MKKSLVVIIIVVLCLSLWGCGPQDKSQYNEKTNQRVSVHGIGFQVPELWKKTVDSGDYFEFVERSKDDKLKNSLVVTFVEGSDIDKELANIRHSSDGSGNQDRGIVDYEEESVSIANMPAKKIEYAQQSGDEKNNGKIILIQMEHDVLEMMFYSSSKAGDDDFDKVLESITETKQ